MQGGVMMLWFDAYRPSFWVVADAIGPKLTRCAGRYPFTEHQGLPSLGGSDVKPTFFQAVLTLIRPDFAKSKSLM
jgi:hypothetical protein